MFSSLFQKTTPAPPSGATNTRRWTFKPNTFAPDDNQTFTVEFGGSVAAEQVTYCLIDGLTLRASATEATTTGTFMGQKTNEPFTITGSPSDIPATVIGPTQIDVYVGTTLSGSSNSVQTVTLGSPSAGNFTLSFIPPGTFSAQTTANIVYTATATAVRDALVLLDGIGTGGVVVTGNSGGPYTVTFGGVLAGIDVNTLTLNAGGLTGATPTVVYTTHAGLAKLSRCAEFEFACNRRFTAGYTLDSAFPSYSYVVERPPELDATIILQHDSVSQGFMTNMRNVDTLYCRLIARSQTVIETGFPYRFQLTFPFKFRETERADREDVWSATYRLTPLYDATFASAFEAIVDCAVASL